MDPQPTVPKDIKNTPIVPPTYQTQSSSRLPIIIIGLLIIIFIAIVSVYYLATQQFSRRSSVSPTSITKNTSVPSPTTIVHPTQSLIIGNKTAGWKTYTDPSNLFAFNYPSNLQPTDSQSSFCNTNYYLLNKKIVLTSQSYAPSKNTYLQVEYSFGVSIDPSKGNPKSCYINPQDNSKLEKTITYNGQMYYIGTTSGIAAGCHGNSEIYRTLYKNQCYEIALNWTEDSNWNNPVDVQIASTEKNKSFSILNNIFSTFHFL